MHLLIGPAVPMTPYAPPLYHKYSTEMFSSARPQYTSCPKTDLLVIDELFRHETNSKLLQTLKMSAIEPLAKMNQGKGHAIGFFEQGILLGAGLFLTVLIPAIGYSSWLLISYMRKWSYDK